MEHPLRDLVAPRRSHSASGAADAKDAPRRRRAPWGTRGGERAPWEPAHDWARAPTCSRLEPPGDRNDRSRRTRAFLAHGIARAAEPPAALGLESDHAEAPTPGQQAWACSQHDAQHPGSLPLGMVAGTSHALGLASRRPGARPTGAATALIVARRLSSLRRHGPAPPSSSAARVIGPRQRASPGSPPDAGRMGALASPALPASGARPCLPSRRHVVCLKQRGGLAQAQGQAPPARRRLSDACPAAARSWAQPGRVVLQAAGLRAGDHRRVVVPSWEPPTPAMGDAALAGARGHGAHARKAVPGDRRRARPSAPPCLAPALRWRRAGAAYVLPQALRPSTFQHTVLAQAQPSPVLLPLCTMAAQSHQDKERRLLHWPRACPVNALLHRVTARR